MNLNPRIGDLPTVPRTFIMTVILLAVVAAAISLVVGIVYGAWFAVLHYPWWVAAFCVAWFVVWRLDIRLVLE